MLQLDKKFRCFICYILVMAVVLSTIPFSQVSASEDDSHIQEIEEAIAETVGELKEYAEEAGDDIKSTYSAGDWYTACISPTGAHLPWNYFHNAVQSHVRKTANLADTEISITLQSGKVGRADLYKDINGVRYIWEVKPLSYKSGENSRKGLEQLKGYVEGTSIGNPIHDYGYISGGLTSLPVGHILKLVVIYCNGSSVAGYSIL